MSGQVEQSCELAKIAKLNGGFRKNYGTLLGAFLYLHSINARRDRSLLWTGLISVVCSVASASLESYGLNWFGLG
jgi:hypothetical protein